MIHVVVEVSILLLLIISFAFMPNKTSFMHLKVPWKSLGKDPVIVLIDRVFVLAEPAPDGQHITVI